MHLIEIMGRIVSNSMNNLVKTQVDYRHYEWGKYLKMSKWKSYYYQITEVIKSNPNKLLIIGKGDGIVPAILLNMGIEVTTFDYDETLKPDILGDVKLIDQYVKRGQYDTILCCEVLEHIPFEFFDIIIKKFSDLNVKKVVLSLPNYSKDCVLDLKLQIGKLFNVRKRIINYNRIGKEVWCKEEHFWEINVKDKTLKRIKEILKKYYNIENMFYVFENEYHIFFILKK